MRLLVVVGLLASAAGCMARSDAACFTDADCAGSEECARTGECVAEGSAIRVELAWTVDGQPATEESCAPISELEVLFYEDEREDASYSPTPCPLGRTTYDRMPPRLDRVVVFAYAGDGRVLDQAEAALEASGTTSVTVDLRP